MEATKPKQQTFPPVRATYEAGIAAADMEGVSKILTRAANDEQLTPEDLQAIEAAAQDRTAVLASLASPETKALAGPIVEIEIVVDQRSTERAFANARAMAEVVMTRLDRNVHYAIIPGTQQESLLDPGASTLMNVARVRPRYAIEKTLEDDDGHVTLFVRNDLIYIPAAPLDLVVAQGVGAASSHEVRYAYRWVDEEDVPASLEKADLKQRQGRNRTQYRIPNPDLGDLWNTLYKMACKRSDVDAAQQLPGVAEALARIRNRSRGHNA